MEEEGRLWEEIDRFLADPVVSPQEVCFTLRLLPGTSGIWSASFYTTKSRGLVNIPCNSRDRIEAIQGALFIAKEVLLRSTPND